MARPPRGNRQVLLLAFLFGLSVVSGAIVVSAAAIVGLSLSGSAALATVPITFALVGAMAATLPIAHLMARKGRRFGFAVGTAVSTCGALVAATGIAFGSFALFCFGSFGLGVLGGVAPYYRFAAVEVTPPERHARAIGYVLAGGVGAGLLGPPISAATRGFWPQSVFAGSYVAMALLGAVILALLWFLRAPAPAHHGATNARPMRAIMRDPRAVAAVLAAVTAFAAMVATMVAAPLSLDAVGFGFASVALVIQAHVVAMYAPSFVSGSLVARFGTGRIMAAGLALLASCVAINLAGHTVIHHWVALVLLGFGWNFLFVAATTLLTSTHLPHEKAKVQGANDLVVASTGALAALAAGPLHATIGWVGLNLLVGLLLIGAALSLLLLMRRRSPQAAPPAQAAVP